MIPLGNRFKVGMVEWNNSIIDIVTSEMKWVHACRKYLSKIC
jgi:hypothetical protein